MCYTVFVDKTTGAAGFSFCFYIVRVASWLAAPISQIFSLGLASPTFDTSLEESCRLVAFFMQKKEDAEAPSLFLSELIVQYVFRLQIQPSHIRTLPYHVQKCPRLIGRLHSFAKRKLSHI